MGKVKELYIEIVERRTQVLIDTGMDPEDAYNLASETAYKSLGDHMADKADHYRQLKKEGQQ